MPIAHSAWRLTFGVPDCGLPSRRAPDDGTPKHGVAERGAICLGAMGRGAICVGAICLGGMDRRARGGGWFASGSEVWEGQVSRRKAKRSGGAAAPGAVQVGSAALVGAAGQTDAAAPDGSSARVVSAMPGQPTRATNGATALGTPCRRRWLLAAAIVAEACWIAALAAMALTMPK